MISSENDHHASFEDIDLQNGGIVNPGFAVETEQKHSKVPNGIHLSPSNLDESDYPTDGKGHRRSIEVAPTGGANQPTAGNQGCGWLFFRPAWLQKLQTAKWLLVILCWAGAIQGMVVNGFVNGCITTIEKRYNLKSASTGFIAGSYDIAAVLCAIPVSYLGSLPSASKSRWLGWGLVVMGLGSYTFSLPHFMADRYDGSKDSTEEVLYCLKQNNMSDSCTSKSNTYLRHYKHIFALGQFLHGVGASPMYTLGTAYLDEAVQVKMSSLYLGIYHGMAVVGPAIGYILGGYFLNLYIDIPNTPPPTVSIENNWLGAWWIGFLVSGTMALLLSIFMMAFPKDIPGAAERTLERVQCAVDVPGSEAKAFSRVRDLPGAAFVLLKNPCFVFLSFAESTEGILLSGFATFMPKIIQSQFDYSAGMSGLFVGALAVPAGGGGTLLGGWLIKHLKLECAGILKLCFSVNFVCFLCSICFVMSCPSVPLAGVTTTYADRGDYVNDTDSSPFSIVSQCNADCECPADYFHPVCGSDKILYYSPCHAGCKEVSSSSGNLTDRTYAQCACVESSFQHRNMIETGHQSPLNNLNIGLQPALKYLQNTSHINHQYTNQSYEAFSSRVDCGTSCALLPFFLATFFVVMLLTFIVSMPGVSATLRCVPDSHRSFALGIQWIFIRLLGTIPGPILFGTAIDDTCLVWQETCDEETGACQVYDNRHLSKSLLALALSFKGLSTVFYFISWYFYVKRKHGTVVSNGKPKIRDISMKELSHRTLQTDLSHISNGDLPTPV